MLRRAHAWIAERIAMALGWGIMGVVLLRMAKRDRAYGAMALGDSAPADVAAHRTALIARLEGGNSFVRIEAAHALARELPHPDPVAEAALIRALGDGERFVRSAAASALIELDHDRDPEPIISALRRAEGSAATGDATPEEIVRHRLVGLNRLDPLPKVVDLLTTADDADLRRHAALMLHHVETREEVARALIEAARGDPDPEVRSCAVLSLSETDEGAVSAFVSALTDEDEEVRARAAAQLGGAHDERSLVALVGALDDRSERVTKAAARSLSDRGQEGRAAVVAALAQRPWRRGRKLRRGLRRLERRRRVRDFYERRLVDMGDAS